jgi:hypothetical protein
MTPPAADWLKKKENHEDSKRRELVHDLCPHDQNSRDSRHCRDIVGIIIARRRNKKRSVIKDLEQLRTWDWQGWVEIANTDFLPLFQGKIVATAADRDHAGVLLFGVFLEENSPTALVTAIKARPFDYLTEGRVLVRGLTAHDKKLITTELKDQDLINRICAVMEKGVKPETCLVLNSIDIQHMDSPEAMAQFEKIWQASLPKQATGLYRGNIRDRYK